MAMMLKDNTVKEISNNNTNSTAINLQDSSSNNDSSDPAEENDNAEETPQAEMILENPSAKNNIYQGCLRDSMAHELHKKQ
eukprot:11572184-Ditylum_brightwellii.AAC.1